MISPVITASATTANVPSMTSLREDGRRITRASAITTGATAMMPMASDANQCCQVSSTDPRQTRPGDCRREEANNVPHPNEVKIRTEVVLDQSSCNQGFCPVA